MSRSNFAITLTSLALLVAALAAQIPHIGYITVLLVSVSPVLVIWMVYSVLRDPSPQSGKRFSDGHFYEDSSIKGIPEDETNG